MAKEVADAESGTVTKRLRQRMEQRGNEEKGKDRGSKYGDRAVIRAVEAEVERQKRQRQSNICHCRETVVISKICTYIDKF